ncbi:MAG: glycosyltransferase family 2 protein [Clostridia bacterium]|nr:glycosyltransferase family 2 protein [Clostridia bacterium]
MPKISVVVPVYKVEEYLECCVNSILTQTFKEFDLILVDDGSPDRCGEMCEQFNKNDSRITVIHKENGGLSDARNYGIEWALQHSDSEWITFIDSDDYVNPELLEKLLAAAEDNSCDVSCCYFLTVNDHDYNTNEKSNAKSFITTPEEMFCKAYEDKRYAIQNCAWAKLYKKTLFKDARYPVGRLFEDVYLTHKLLFPLKKIAIYDDRLYYYYYNPESISHSKLTVKKLKDRFDGRMCRLEYFYANNIPVPFKITFDECCRDVQKCILLYSPDDELTKTAKAQKKEMFAFMKTLQEEQIGFVPEAEYKNELKKTKRKVLNYIKKEYGSNAKSSGKIQAALIALRDLIKLYANRA